MSNWLTEVPLAPPAPEEPGAKFAPRSTEGKVRSRRIPAPNERLYQKRRHIRRQRGIDVTAVPESVVREHVEKLLGYGMNQSMIAAAAGCSPSAIDSIASGTRKWAQRTIAEAILAVGPQPHPLQRCVLAIGAVRRIGALRAIGWNYRMIALEVGATTSNIQHIGDGKTITYARWKQVAELYDRISGTTGPDKRARLWAKKQGFMPPLAWEGIDIDHPDATPILDAPVDDSRIDEILFERVIKGRHKQPIAGALRTAVLDYAIEHDWNARHTAEIMCLKHDAAEAALLRRRRKLREQQAAA